MPATLLTYRCPHCQHQTEVDAAQADQAVTCPSCHKPFHPELPTAAPEPALIVPPEVENEPVRSFAPAITSPTAPVLTQAQPAASPQAPPVVVLTQPAQ